MPAATFADINGILNDGAFADRVGIAIIKTAYNVSNEAPETVNHANRLIWSKEALSDVPGNKVKIAKFVIAGYVVAHASDDVATIQAGLTDTVIQSFVDASLSIFA